MQYTGSELVAAGAGSAITILVIAFGGWIWWNYWPAPGEDRSRDARDLARKRLSEK